MRGLNFRADNRKCRLTYWLNRRLYSAPTIFINLMAQAGRFMQLWYFFNSPIRIVSNEHSIRTMLRPNIVFVQCYAGCCHCNKRRFYLYDGNESSCGTEKGSVDYSAVSIGNDSRHEVLGGADFFYQGIDIIGFTVICFYIK